MQFLDKINTFLNKNVGLFLGQKKNFRNVFSWMSGAYPCPSRWVKKRAKFGSENYLCKNFKTKLVPRGFEPGWIYARVDFRQKGLLPGLSRRGFEPLWFISKVIWLQTDSYPRLLETSLVHSLHGSLTSLRKAMLILKPSWFGRLLRH